MTLYQICKEVYDIIVGLYNGTIKYEFNKYMAAMNVGHPGELLEHILASIDYDVVAGKEIPLKKVKKFTEYLKELKKEYEVDELSVVIGHLNSYINEHKDELQDELYFGNYPQTEIEDETLIKKLNEKAGTLPTKENTYKWHDYGYYINGKIESFMWYIDIELDEGKYRGVYFTQYRPYDINDSRDEYFNDYYIVNNIYWFRYEPIKWDILETKNNKVLIISDLILDSQDYNYTDELRIGTVDYLGNKTIEEVYANNYMYSHIRDWLNTIFYETAFNELEKEKIETTMVDNNVKSAGDKVEEYVCSNTNDKIFLMSYEEANKYFLSKDEGDTKGTNYALSQGLEENHNEKSNYWLRSPVDDECDNRIIDYLGYSDFENVINTTIGIRPVCWIDLEKSKF